MAVSAFARNVAGRISQYYLSLMWLHLLPVVHPEGFWLRREKSVENGGPVTSTLGELLPQAQRAALTTEA